MSRMIRKMALAAAALCAVGCTSSRTNTSPSESDILRGQIHEAARGALRNLLTSPQFCRYAEQFRMTHGGVNPALKFAEPINETGNADLDLYVIYDMLMKELVSADRVKIAAVECVGRTPDIADSRTAAVNGSFDSHSVVKSGALLPADVVTRAKLAVLKDNDNEFDHNDDNHAFMVDVTLADASSGKLIWIYSKKFGYVAARNKSDW